LKEIRTLASLKFPPAEINGNSASGSKTFDCSNIKGVFHPAPANGLRLLSA
jgi:hypothetical protein